MKKIPRFLKHPNDVTPDNPTGETLNVGEWIPMGDILEVLSDMGIPFHELLLDYENLKCDKLRSNSVCTEGLFIFPGYYILFVTHYVALPIVRELQVESIPYTCVYAFQRVPGRSPPDYLAKVLASPC